MPVARPKPTHDDWVKTVLFDRGYLARIPGEAIKVYLAIIEACGGVPDRSVTISLRLLMQRTELSCPTVIESLSRLESLGLVVSTTRQRGKSENLLRLRPSRRMRTSGLRYVRRSSESSEFAPDNSPRNGLP